MIHRRFIDLYGFEKDGFELQIEDGGKTKVYPFFGMMKVQNYTRDTPISTTVDYTKDEYEQMFGEELEKLKLV